MELIAEMILMGERAGINHDILMYCLSKGSVQGSILANMALRVFTRNFTPRGAIKKFVNDMGIASELAKENWGDLAVVPAARKCSSSPKTLVRVIEAYKGKDKI